MVVENGGYIDGGPVLVSKPGTRILSPNVFRLGLSNDRPSGVRILLLLLFISIFSHNSFQKETLLNKYSE